MNQNQQLELQDLENAIKGMKNNKTPGQDGIPVDFYKVFWKNLKNTFYQMVIETYDRGTMHHTARKGILNLIPKANKDTRYVKNLRPITLLNTDYKIIEKAIANKMIPALEQIIHTDQRGFMKDRRISVNIRKMLDIMHQADAQDLEAVVLSLDFVKCFDKCSFSILHGSLQFFGFGSIVQEWTKILYKDFSVTVQNNGYFSEVIQVNKGVHQGGCCSSIYFLVIAEILALSLRSNQDIEGLTINDIRNLLNQFADDMDIFSIADEKSIKAIYEELDKFKYQSGFTVSHEKTTLYRIGSLRHSNATMYNLDQFAWSNADITVLGVTIAHENIIEKNYDGIVAKVKQTLNSWYNRGLTLIGKIQVVNTLIASLFVYKMMVLPAIPKNIERNVNNMIRDFIWNGKKAKIAYNILQNPKKEGGLGLVNLKNRDMALKATWPSILHNELDYSKLVYSIMRVNSLQDDIWRCHLNPSDVKKLKIKSQFWEDVLYSWSCYNYYTDFRIENQLIWYNSCIRVGDKPIFWKEARKKGLRYVHQLFSNQALKSEEQMYQEYGITRLMYNSLKVSIPREWKLFFTRTPAQTFLPIPPHNLDNALYAYPKQLSRKVYSLLAEDLMLLHNKYMKWKMETRVDLSPSVMDFTAEIRSIYRTTNITKYRSFQYRLLLRGLVTNIQLFKWNLAPNDMCYFCTYERESITHLLIECHVVKELWKKIFEFIQKEYNVSEICIDTPAILFNKIVNKQGQKHVANFICLVTKQYIYSQKCLMKELSFNELYQKIKHLQNVEKYIAIKNNRHETHQKKWGIPTG